MQSGRAISPSVPWSSQMSGQAGLCHFFSKLLGRFGGNRSATGGRTVTIPVPACRSRWDLCRYVAVSGLHGPPRTPGGENPPGRDETSRSTRSKNGRKTAMAQPREHSQTSGNDQRVGLGGPEVAKNTTDAGSPPDGAGTAGTAVRSPEFCKKPGFSQLQTRISQPRIGVQRSGLAHRNRGKFVRPVSIRPTPDDQPEAPENATFLQKHARFRLFSGSAVAPPASTAGYMPDRTVRCPGSVPGSSGKAKQGTAWPAEAVRAAGKVLKGAASMQHPPGDLKSMDSGGSVPAKQAKLILARAQGARESRELPGAIANQVGAGGLPNVYGHITLKTPVLVRSLKLSNVEPS